MTGDIRPAGSSPGLAIALPTPSLRTTVAQALLVPARTSPRSRLWIAGYHALHVPTKAVGTARWYRIERPEGAAELVLAGRPERFRGLLQKALEDRPRLDGRAVRVPLWDPDRFTRIRSPLVAVEVHPWAASRFSRAGWVIWPGGVQWRGRLANMPPTPPSRSLASDLGRVERGDYALAQSDGSRRDWTEFRERMLIPYASNRFGVDAALPSPVTLRQLRSRGRLLFITRGGERVVGACVVCTAGELWMPCLGVRDGDIRFMHDGGLAALYALTIDWAKGQGMTRINLGRTPSFVDDGLTWFKQKWGFEPEPDPLVHRLALRVDPTDPVIASALPRRRFWIEHSGRLALYDGPRSEP